MYSPLAGFDDAGCAPVLSITAFMSALRLAVAMRSRNCACDAILKNLAAARHIREKNKNGLLPVAVALFYPRNGKMHDVKEINYFYSCRNIQRLFFFSRKLSAADQNFAVSVANSALTFSPRFFHIYSKTL
jgi:hypothetical protein